MLRVGWSARPGPRASAVAARDRIEETNASFNAPSSFGDVAAEISPPLLRYLARHVGDHALAEDLLQETLIRVARGLPEFAGDATFRTWAYAIATRVIADHFRKAGNRASIVEMSDAEESAAEPGREGRRLVVDEMNACVRQVIDSLPVDYRAALILHDIEGLTDAQTAEVCGCSLATSKIRIHRARSRLRAALERRCDFYRGDDGVLRCDRKAGGDAARPRGGTGTGN